MQLSFLLILFYPDAICPCMEERRERKLWSKINGHIELTFYNT